MKSELELLKEKVRQLEEKQRNCNHIWQNPVEDTIEEEIWEIQSVGIDVFPAPTGKFKTVPCWSRTCFICGKKEYTKELEEVAIKTEHRPKF